MPKSEATGLFFGTDANLTGEITKKKGLLYLNGTAGEPNDVRAEFWALRIENSEQVKLFNAIPEVCSEITAQRRGIDSYGVAMRPLPDKLLVGYVTRTSLIGGEFKDLRDILCVIPIA